MDRFFDKVKKIPGGCWLWTGSTQVTGYGSFWSGEKPVSAHRFSYDLHKGPIPEGMHVLHSCHVRPCVNPDHLRLGTNQDNMDDMVNAGRQNKPKGEHHGFSKLTDMDITNIRNLLSDGVLKQWQIGDMFNVGQQAISKIKTNVNWR